MKKAMAVALLLAASCTLAGCRDVSIMFEPATMYADTRTLAKDGFTNKSPQWAYEGEPVTFDFAPDLAVADYTVFLWPDGVRDVLTSAELTMSYSRGVGTFKAGREPRHNTVRAEAYGVRGRIDWYYDKDAKMWSYHVPASDEIDMLVGKAEMEIICYRVDLDVVFEPRGRQVKKAELHLIKDDGSRTIVRMRVPPSLPGFELIGPDRGGRYHVRYTPTWKEVNRVGTTGVELLLTFADGTQELISREIETP